MEISLLHLPVLKYGRNMQPRKLDRATVVKEYEDTSGIRMYCRMIRCRNDVLAPIAGSDGKRFKWCRVQ